MRTDTSLTGYKVCEFLKDKLGGEILLGADWTNKHSGQYTILHVRSIVPEENGLVTLREFDVVAAGHVCKCTYVKMRREKYQLPGQVYMC